MSAIDRFYEILIEVNDEAERSIEKHGEQLHLPMGTGPACKPLDFGRRFFIEGQSRAVSLARAATDATDSRSSSKGDGTVTWRDILTEEVFEAYAARNATELRAELVQVAAVVVKMIDALDSKGQPT